MNPSLRILLTLLALPLVITIAYWLDQWIIATASVHYGGSYAWTTSFSRLITASALLALSWLLLWRLPRNRPVAAVYLASGVVLTFLQPLAVSAVSEQSSPLKASLVLTEPVVRFLLNCGTNAHFTFAFFIAIGIGGFLRRDRSAPLAEW